MNLFTHRGKNPLKEINDFTLFCSLLRNGLVFWPKHECMYNLQTRTKLLASTLIKGSSGLLRSGSHWTMSFTCCKILTRTISCHCSPSSISPYPATHLDVHPSSVSIPRKEGSLDEASANKQFISSALQVSPEKSLGKTAMRDGL